MTSSSSEQLELPRRAATLAKELLTSVRAVVINGPRQSGKSTLARALQQGRGPIVTLDDPVQLELARADPIGFLDALPPRSAIDEFQRAGEPLLLALKRLLDLRRERGQFLLTGSTRFLTTRRLAETLTGRVAIVELLPLSAGEISGVAESFVERAFGDVDLLAVTPAETGRADYATRIATGGFPELALEVTASRARNAWCRSYLQTVLAPPNLAQVDEVRRPDLPIGLIRQVAARSAGEVVIADLARELNANEATIRTHLDLLTTLYLIRLLPGWSASHTTRSKKRPVVHIVDSALASHLLGADPQSLTNLTSPWFGPLLESYVVGELAKQALWSDDPTELFHYRDRDRREIDVIIERHDRVVAIEVKAGATPTPADARHMRYIQQRLGNRFVQGVVLHTGHHRVRLSERIVAIPVAALWTSEAP